MTVLVSPLTPSQRDTKNVVPSLNARWLHETQKWIPESSVLCLVIKVVKIFVFGLFIIILV